MKKTGRKLMAMAVCTAMIAAMTGCGSTAEPATTESTVSTEAKTVEAITEEAAATAATTKSGYPIGDSVQAIIDKGVLVVGTDSAYAPFAFVDTTSDSSDPVGIDIEIAKAIADEIGVDIQLEPMQFKALLSSLTAGMVDICIDGITPTDERKEVADFSDSYIECQDRMMIQADRAEELSTLEDFYGKKIAANSGSIQEKFTQDFITDADIFSSPNLPTSVMELKAGNVDGIVVERSVGQQYLEAYPELTYSDAVMEGSYAKTYAVAMNKGCEDLQTVINGVVDKLVEEGKIEEWLTQYSELASKAVKANAAN
mgnify:CR=1 FL=1